jgi:hypothetical protein
VEAEALLDAVDGPGAAGEGTGDFREVDVVGDDQAADHIMSWRNRRLRESEKVVARRRAKR